MRPKKSNKRTNAEYIKNFIKIIDTKIRLMERKNVSNEVIGLMWLGG